MYLTRNLYRAALAMALLATWSAAALATEGASGAASRPVIHQLRIYEIFDHNKQAFHERFRDHAMRIMAKYDFDIVAMWESRSGDRTEFVYLLEWPDKQAMADSWARFMADEEWAAIKRQTGSVHGRLVGEIEDRTLEVTDYSPQRVLKP